VSAPSLAGRHGQPDEIDAAIDTFFAKLGRNWKALAFWLLLLGVIVFYVLPNWKTVSGPLLTILQLLFQLLFAAMFLIIQFGALFWFLGRGRVYWIEPGESGIWFKDYKGNPSVVEVAHRVVTLVRGVKSFKEMGGEVSRGLLLVGPPGTGKSYLAQADEALPSPARVAGCVVPPKVLSRAALLTGRRCWLAVWSSGPKIGEPAIR